MARANETSMDSLHGALCGYFLRLINGQIPELMEFKEKVIEGDDEVWVTRWKETGLMVRPGAGDLAVMAKFLKDNAITGVAAKGSTLSALEKQLAQKHTRKGKLPTEADAAQALKELGGNLLQ